jgi:ribonuclease Z
VAYLTDFILDEEALELLGGKLSGCDTIICESQYRHDDLELATRNYHMTSVLAARLAARANAKHLVLFHLSDRYSQQDWREMLREAQAVFPATTFASQWNLNP